MRKLDVHIHTNKSCNLRCIHCYNNSGEASDIPQTEALLDLIEYLCNTYDADIHLEGGEIFLRPDLIEKMNVFSDKILNSVTVTTNGTIFFDGPDQVNTLRRIRTLRISVEGGSAQTHETIRGGNFETVLGNAMKFQGLDIPVCIRITLNRLNFRGFINDTIVKLANRGFKCFQVYEFQSVGRGKDSADILSLKCTLDELFEEMYSAHPKGVTLKMMFSAVREKEILKWKSALESKGYTISRVQEESSVSIRENGDVYKCAWDNDPSNAICNWYNDKEARQIIDRSDLRHSCVHCSMFCIALDTR